MLCMFDGVQGDRLSMEKSVLYYIKEGKLVSGGIIIIERTNSLTVHLEDYH